MIDPLAFKQAARRFASGVTVVTTLVSSEEGESGPVADYGVTVSSFASLSLNPLLVTVSLASYSRLLTYVRASGRFAVSVLRSDQQAISQYFSSQGRDPEPGRFTEVATRRALTGAPIIDGCLSYFDCELHDLLTGGDHTIMVGRVVSAGGSPVEEEARSAPLLYYDGAYCMLADALAVQLRLTGITAREIIDAQAAIEPVTAALAAENATAEQLDRLAALIDEADEALDDPVLFTELGIAFHIAVGEASGNRALAGTLAALRREKQSLLEPRNTPERARRAHELHRRILDRIRAGDADGARALMAGHVRLVGSQVVPAPPAGVTTGPEMPTSEEK
ncbi:flavin reductase [Rhizohabitans arisaemae]|uniref:flavin reductase n=1 Tax=Rhizohabitans arisaemae TaxID=2720610 RepID=UPI0024B080F7|nr:flavin reductase [Rhizohabitans arisaemae]